MAQGNATDKIANWLQGRYGADELSVFTMLVALVLVIINLFVGSAVLGVIALLLLVVAIFRIVSKNYAQRAKENHFFVTKIGPLRPWLRDPRGAWAENRNYKHVSCVECGQRLRVPRHKGRLRVTCPACHSKFETKS